MSKFFRGKVAVVPVMLSKGMLTPKLLNHLLDVGRWEFYPICLLLSLKGKAFREYLLKAKKLDEHLRVKCILDHIK